MNNQEPLEHSAGWSKSLICLALAVMCFQAAYASARIPFLGVFTIGYAWFLLQLARQSSVRRAFYFGLAAGLLCYAPQLFFFWNLFGPGATALWVVLAFWVGLFTATVCGSLRRWGRAKTMWLVPILWMGTEYFRSELYYLKFSWLNVGYAWPAFLSAHLGMYALGFATFAIAAALPSEFPRKIPFARLAVIIGVVVLVAAFSLSVHPRTSGQDPVSIAGVQMEFPSAGILAKALDGALAKNRVAPLFVLSEYTLDGPPPASLKDWCRANSRYLVVGGKEIVTNRVYYNTAFVIGTNGEVVFQQGKNVPIQFFDDGLPAKTQQVWDSPWGKIGICICYDLSYTRVTDRLVEEGAQMLIVPTMDVAEWGRHEHALHSRVAPVRAAEYGIPIFRLASSGISQAVEGDGTVVGHTAFDNPDEVLSAQFDVPARGSLPLDRFLAPLCTALTAMIILALWTLAWKDKRASYFKDSPAPAGN